MLFGIVGEVPLPLQRLEFVDKEDPVIYPTECGHGTLSVRSLEVYGFSLILRLPIIGGKAKFCIDCIVAMGAQCVRCYEPILAGDPVTLVGENGFGMPPHRAVMLPGDLSPLYVGCTKKECMLPGSKVAGIWSMEGGIIQFAVETRGLKKADLH